MMMLWCKMLDIIYTKIKNQIEDNIDRHYKLIEGSYFQKLMTLKVMGL